MASGIINIVGKVTKVSEVDAKRLSAFIILCERVLASVPIQADGTFRIALSRADALAQSSYAITLAVGPSSAGNHLEHLPSVPKVTLKRADLEKAEKEFRATEISIADDVLKLWWRWCYWYCVSGRVLGPDGCAAPGAEVTVYSVTHTESGYRKIPRATVTTSANGTFTACFEWCTCSFCFPCWPCWPIWWSCWPWWWEWDILRVIEAIEKQPPIPGPGPVERITGAGTMIRPDTRSLVRGQGFGIADREAFAPDAQRTELIASKFSDARIRELFPWWWWCCDDPNIVFSVTQNNHLIVNENPATSTRWCFEEGGSVTLVGNSATGTICNRHCPPESGFAWTNVGDYVEVADIKDGYATPSGSAATDTSDMPFAGQLFLYGQFAASTTVAYYQVNAGQWVGNPVRGGTRPTVGSGAPIGEPLDHVFYIYNADGTFNSSHTVRMGPFTHGGLVNLYATPAARQNGPTPPTLLPFPAVPPGGFVVYDHQGLIAHTFDSSNLISGMPIGAVDLAVVGYDAAFVEVLTPHFPPPGPPDAPLTLMIDNSGLTAARINSIAAFKSDGTPVMSMSTGPCPAFDIGPGGYVQIGVTVTDNSGHLFGYNLTANHGSSVTDLISPPGTRGYKTNPLGSPTYAQNFWVGGTEVITHYPPVDCCYEFLLRIGKRVTSGDGFPSLGDDGFQTMTLKVSS
jgi:hypothetical protein